MRRLILIAVAAVTVPLFVAGCSRADTPAPEFTRAPVVIQGAAPGEPGRALGSADPVEVVAVPHTATDVAFVQNMIQHHAQAMVMIDMIDGRTDNTGLTRFAERMDITQTAEVDLMEQWLTQRGEAVPPWQRVRLEMGSRLAEGSDDGAHGAHGHEELAAMPGMLTGQEITELAAARGEQFDRLWLEGMTRHHQGAVAMVQALYAAGGGGEAEVDLMASHIESDQGIEINRMADMLSEL